MSQMNVCSGVYLLTGYNDIMTKQVLINFSPFFLPMEKIMQVITRTKVYHFGSNQAPWCNYINLIIF